MASPLLDFKKFKHIKSDDKSTTLQHKDGHMLTINHNALSKPNQAQLQAMSKIAPQVMDSQKESDKQYGKVIVKEAMGGEIEQAPKAEASRIDTGYGKVIMKAAGGDIKEAPHGTRPDAGWGKVTVIDKAEGGEVCMHCGGIPRKQYADSEELVSEDDSAPTKQPLVPDEDPLSKYGKTDFFKEAQQSYPAQSPEDQHKAKFEANLQSQRQQNYSHYPESDLAVKAEKQTQEQEAAKQASVDMEVKNAGYNARNTPNGAMAGQQAPMQVENSPVPMDPAQSSQGIAQQQAPVDQAQQPEAQQSQVQQPMTQTPVQQPAPTMPLPTPEHQVDPMQVKAGTIDEYQKMKSDALNGHIQSKTYSDLYNKKSTLGKVGTIFGLMLSGAGSGLTGQPNALLSMMDKEIDRDYESQKTSKENARSFYKMSMDEAMQNAQKKQLALTGKLTEAQTKHMYQQAAIEGEALGHMRSNAAALHNQADLVKKMSPDDPKRPAAEQLLAMMSQGLDNKVANIADLAASKTALLNMGNNQSDPDRAHANKVQMYRMSGNESLAKQTEERYVPGIGEGTKPVGEPAREKIRTHQDMDRALGAVIDYAKKYGGTAKGKLSPQISGVGQTLLNNLTDQVRIASDQGVYKPSEAHFLNETLGGNPANLLSKITSLPKVEAIRRLKNADYQNLLKNEGLPLKPLPSQSSNKPDRPATVIQGGHTFHLNPNTGKYE